MVLALRRCAPPGIGLPGSRTCPGRRGCLAFVPQDVSRPWVSAPLRPRDAALPVAVTSLSFGVGSAGFCVAHTFFWRNVSSCHRQRAHDAAQCHNVYPFCRTNMFNFLFWLTAPVRPTDSVHPFPNLVTEKSGDHSFPYHRFLYIHFWLGNSPQQN